MIRCARSTTFLVPCAGPQPHGMDRCERGRYRFGHSLDVFPNGTSVNEVLRALAPVLRQRRRAVARWRSASLSDEPGGAPLPLVIAIALGSRRITWYVSTPTILSCSAPLRQQHHPNLETNVVGGTCTSWGGVWPRRIPGSFGHCPGCPMPGLKGLLARVTRVLRTM